MTRTPDKTRTPDTSIEVCPVLSGSHLSCCPVLSRFVRLSGKLSAVPNHPNHLKGHAMKPDPLLLAAQKKRRENEFIKQQIAAMDRAIARAKEAGIDPNSLRFTPPTSTERK